MKTYDVSIKWLAVSCYEIRYKDITIVTDPFITDCVGTDLTWEAVEGCDMVCVSHGHWDHVTDIPQLAEKYQPLLLCGDKTALPMARWLNFDPARIHPMYPNMELDFGKVKVRALYGRHKSQGKGFSDLYTKFEQNDYCQQNPFLAEMQPLGSMEYRNYLFTFPNGTKVLIWGSDPTEEQINLCKEYQPDIAIIQRGTKPHKIAEKADFAAAIGAKVVFPHHHDFHKVDDPAIIETFKEEYLKRVPEGTFVTPVHGEWVHL